VEQRATITKELGALLQKYRYPETWPYKPRAYVDDSRLLVIQRKYGIEDINRSISNIIEKKYRWARHYEVFLRIFYYITLGITLLIFLFRHSTVRTFFLTLLSAVLLTIFTSLVIAWSRSGDLVFWSWIIAYFILFFLGTLLTWYNKKRKLITGIWINLFVFLIPVFPLLVFGWNYAWKRKQAADKIIPFEYPDLELHILYAEMAGSLLLLVLLALYINKLYRRWYSLPEE
jgi:hypothetical protein